jgi:hypothetical protein
MRGERSINGSSRRRRKTWATKEGQWAPIFQGDLPLDSSGTVTGETSRVNASHPTSGGIFPNILDSPFPGVIRVFSDENRPTRLFGWSLRHLLSLNHFLDTASVGDLENKKKRGGLFDV